MKKPQVEDIAELFIHHQIREINMYKGPSVTHYKFEFDPENMLRCWEECKVKSDYSSRCRAVDHFNQQNRWKKRGISIIPIKYGIAFSEGFLNQVWGGFCLFGSSGIDLRWTLMSVRVSAPAGPDCECSAVCLEGGRSGSHLQGRLCSGLSWRDGDGSRDPHQDATGTGTTPEFIWGLYIESFTSGLLPVCCQVASRELHIPSSKIYISETCTNAVPNASPSAASFGTDANGMAVQVRSSPCQFFCVWPAEYSI